MEFCTYRHESADDNRRILLSKAINLTLFQPKHLQPPKKYSDFLHLKVLVLRPACCPLEILPPAASCDPFQVLARLFQA